MAAVVPIPATLRDLSYVEGKAELIAGRIVQHMPSGDLPSRVALEIAMSLRQYAKATGIGVAYADGIGFALSPPLTSGRESFSPDASFYIGPLPRNKMRFVEGAPTLAVEVRSEGDYGPSAEVMLAAKRADYFEAGTLVVWDVDPLAQTVAVYRAADSENGVIYHAGQIADAEPAVPGWRMTVSDIFAA
jgi:Uma2 family endonuclease